MLIIAFFETPQSRVCPFVSRAGKMKRALSIQHPAVSRDANYAFDWLIADG